MKSCLQGAPTYQISSSTPKVVKSCAIELEKVSRKWKAQLDNRPLISFKTLLPSHFIQI